MKLQCSLEISDNEYHRLLTIAHGEMAVDPKFSGLIINLKDDYSIKLPRKQMQRDIAFLKYHSDKNSYWNTPKAKLAKMHSEMRKYK